MSAGAKWGIGVGIVLVLFVILALIGNGMIEEEIANDLRDNQVILEHIGELHSVELDWTDTANDERMEWDHYDIEGGLGAGELVLRTEAQGPDAVEVVLEGELHLPSGEVHDLFP
jgi:hypothetical protein